MGRALAARKQEQVAKALAMLTEKRAASLVGRDLRLRAELTDTATAASAALESGVTKWLRRGAGKRELAEHARKVLGNEEGPIDPRELNLAKQQVQATVSRRRVEAFVFFYLGHFLLISRALFEVLL